MGCLEFYLATKSTSQAGWLVGEQVSIADVAVWDLVSCVRPVKGMWGGVGCPQAITTCRVAGHTLSIAWRAHDVPA